MKNKTILNLSLSLTLIGLSLFATHSSAGVSSISAEELVEVGDESHMQVSVQCSSRSERVFLHRSDKSQQWCDSVIGTFCSRKKMVAARTLCSRRYQSAIADTKDKHKPAAKPVASVAKQVEKKQKPEQVDFIFYDESLSVAELKREKFEIEQKVIELQAQRLDLRRRENAVRKRQLELTNTTVTKN